MEMDSLNTAVHFNLIGFTVGVAIYALIATMVERIGFENVDRLVLKTGLHSSTRGRGSFAGFDHFSEKSVENVEVNAVSLNSGNISTYT